MSLLRFKTFLVILFLIVISACTDSRKNEKSGKDETIDTLSAGDRKTFLFLTEWFNKVGVYKYDLTKKKYSPVWWHPQENVVMLVYKSADHPSFFLTAEKIGMKGTLPSFSRLKLFIVSSDLSETKQIDNIGSGMQFTARWSDNDNLEVIYTSVDKTIASYVNRYTKVYDHYGKLVDSDIKTFDIIKTGFPELVPPRNSTISPSGKYGVSIKNDSLFLKSAEGEILKFVTLIKHPLNKLKWSDNEEYMFLSTLDLDNESIKSVNPETSELFVYSLTADSLIESFTGSGIKNFLLMNNLLVFDDGFNDASMINVYDLNKRSMVGVINPRGGCGLQVMPILSQR